MANRIADLKRQLILPIDFTPSAWPARWKFPGPPWPPGWPREGVLPAVLDVTLFPILPMTHARRVLVDVMVRDEYREPTDELGGEMLRVQVYRNGDRVRLRESQEGEVWSREALLGIDPFYVQKAFDLDLVGETATVSFVVGIYGWTCSEKVVEVEV